MSAVRVAPAGPTASFARVLSPQQPQQQQQQPQQQQQQPQQQRRHGQGSTRTDPTLRQIAAVAYHWLLWAAFALLLFGQVLGIAWTRVSSEMHLYFGQDPARGVYEVLGTNDAPFTDRAYVCSLRGGRVYRPVQLQQALDAPTAITVRLSDDADADADADTDTDAVSGYRMVKRTGLRLDAAAMAAYQDTCNAIALTKDEIVDRCRVLGYNVTLDALRVIVADGPRDVAKLIPDTLPVIAIPFADNLPFSRYVLPGRDGSACMLRMSGAYETRDSTAAALLGVNRTVRERKTVELLGRPGGAWRNGWYEDPSGERWCADVLSSDATPLGVAAREFDIIANTEQDCRRAGACGKAPRFVSWGPKLRSVDNIHRFTSLTILNSNHVGIFLFDAEVERYVESVYDLETILSNVSLGALLVRWAVAMAALQNAYRTGATTELQSAGIGVLSCARGFRWLPLLLLPRLKMTLAVFATVGCTFDGSQLALSSAWFVMYPGIAEFVFFVFSLLNLLAKLLRRRAADALFGPTLLFFCAMHYARTDLAQSGWLEYDGRMATLVSSDQLERLSALDFFRDGTLLKLGGGVRSLFLVKLAVVALNLLPLVFSRASASAAATTNAEIALALHLAADGGIGASRPPPAARVKQVDSHTTLLSSYELLRLGYVVVGDACLVSVDDWFALVLMTTLRLHRTSALRVTVFEVVHDAARMCYAVHRKPLLLQINDARLSARSPWSISTRHFR